MAIGRKYLIGDCGGERQLRSSDCGGERLSLFTVHHPETFQSFKFVPDIVANIFPCPLLELVYDS